MRRWSVILLAGAVSALLAWPAAAAPRRSDWYGSAKLGIFVPNDETDGLDGFDDGWSFDGALGTRINRNFAVEFGLGWYGTEDDDYDVEVSVVPLTFTAKGILPLSRGQLELYGGIGVGAYFAEADWEGGDDSDTALGVHLVAGLDANLTPDLALGFQAKWFTAEAEFEGEDVDVGGATYSVGLKFLF